MDDEEDDDSHQSGSALTQAIASVQPHTLLPSPFAALISLGTATSSLSLRVAGFFGNAVINTARFGTLTGFELGRSVLESILAKAGQDVVQNSSTQMGRAAAESVLSNALNSLHYAVTHSSFLVSAGFQIGSTGIATGLAVSQYLLNILDAVFGDTDTSKAIATIVAMVQREMANEVSVGKDKVSIADIITGAIGFVLLQRWCREQTHQQMLAEGIEEVILDIVVVVDEEASRNAFPASGYSARHESQQVPLLSSRPPSRIKGRRASFVSATGDGVPFDATAFGDSTSYISRTPSSQAMEGYGHGTTEAGFRQGVLSQLKPGSTVRITSNTTTTHTITVEIDGDATSYVQPPHGYELVSADGQISLGEDGQKLVFRSQQDNLQTGHFEIDDLITSDPDVDEDHGFAIVDGPDLLSHTSGEMTRQNIADSPREPKRAQIDLSMGVKANQKKRRSSRGNGLGSNKSLSTFFRRNDTIEQQDQDGSATPRRTSIRHALKDRTSYKNLLDFWNGGQGQANRSDPAKDQVQLSSQRSYAVQQPAMTLRDGSVGAVPFRPPSLNPPFDLTSRPQASHSFRRHKRGTSSIFSLESSSSQSLVLHGTASDLSKDRVARMERTGELAGQYPLGRFSYNVARFVRFAVASYGESFLRLTGSLRDNNAADAMQDEGHLAEHITFSKYTKLPAATVLLSSFVDPQGGPNASGQAETGLPLIHYVSLDHESKAVVVSFRGTLGFEDVLTDLTADYDDLFWEGKAYKCHQGILACAKRLLSLHAGRLLATVTTALDEFEDYGLIFCGHSLGGAVAAVLAILLAQRNVGSDPRAPAFVTRNNTANRRLYGRSGGSRTAPKDMISCLPGGRPIHAYAYGPAASVSPELQADTSGLITTIINSKDHISYLSLGTLRDMHAIAHAFKTDPSNAKAEVRRRVWRGLTDIFRNRTGLASFGGNWSDGHQPQGEDHWPWAAMQSLRSKMVAEKLVPPGEVFIVSSEPVLQRYAFVHDLRSDARADAEQGIGDASTTRSFRPAQHVTLTHVRDVERRFAEVRFGASMWTDHFPGRYERVLETLSVGMGS